MGNRVILEFHYATDLLGRLVCIYQLLRGNKHWRFCHVTVRLATGGRYDRMIGQTAIGTNAVPLNHVALILSVEPSDLELDYRAKVYLRDTGDNYLGDCTTFVRYMLRLPSLVGDTPAELFESAINLHLTLEEYL
jgi:hypothetical protein